MRLALECEEGVRDTSEKTRLREFDLLCIIFPSIPSKRDALGAGKPPAAHTAHPLGMPSHPHTLRPYRVSQRKTRGQPLSLAL